MHVTVREPAELEIVLTIGRAELAALYQATRQGRRNRAQARLLERFGDYLMAALGEPSSETPGLEAFLGNPVIGKADDDGAAEGDD